MAKWTKRRRRQAALKGWRTRRRNFLKRSRAAKKGWRTRRARAKAPRKAPRKGIHEYQIILEFKSQRRTRHVDFNVVASSKEEAQGMLRKAIKDGSIKDEDGETRDIAWLANPILSSYRTRADVLEVKGADTKGLKKGITIR